MTDDDQIRVTTFVSLDPATTFAVFTTEIDAWWKHGNRYRTGTESEMRLEPGVGGRLLEIRDDDTQDGYEFGRVRVWEPGRRLVLDWRGKDLAEGETTEVEIRFDEAAGGTRVILEHRGFAALGHDHPARYGLQGPAFKALVGHWWADMLTRFRSRTS